MKQMTSVRPQDVGRTLRPRDLDRNLLVLVVLLVAATAWAALAATHGSSGHPATGHAAVPEPVIPGPHTHHSDSAAGGSTPPDPLIGTVLSLGAWTIMVVAMMLPPALPLLQTIRRLVSRQPDPWRLTTLSAMTFIGAWTVVGVVVVVGDLGVQALAERNWPDADPRWLTASVLVGAGVYQFTPLKDLCLRGCRSPRSFVLAHWQGRRSSGAETVTLSGAYALSCIGCCWALMLLCFAVGAATLPVMVALTVVMAAERLVPWGRRLVRPAGLVLIVLGAVTALSVMVPSIPHL